MAQNGHFGRPFAKRFAGLLWPTCNHNHQLLAAGSGEIKPSVFW